MCDDAALKCKIASMTVLGGFSWFSKKPNDGIRGTRCELKNTQLR